MKTIRRNAHRMIDAVKTSVVKVTYYDQRSGGMKPSTLEAAFADYARYDWSKLTDQGGGKYVIHVHSNLWFELFTEEAVQRIEKARAEFQRNLDNLRTQPPSDRGVTRVQHLMHRRVTDTPSTDVGETDPRKLAMAATATRTRLAMGSQIAEACNALGVELGLGHEKGVGYYVVNGTRYNVKELADLVLEGGFDAGWDANEIRVNWDSPLITAMPQQEAADALRELADELDSVQDLTPEMLRVHLARLRSISRRIAAPEKTVPAPEWPSGASEPEEPQDSVICARTGVMWMRHRRSGGAWLWTDGRVEATWYQMNIVDPMSEGFRKPKM